MAGFAVVDGLDLGLFSDDARSVSFWHEEVGLPFVETLRHSPTYEERFYSVGGSSLKINYSTEPMPSGRSDYTGLEFAGASAARELVDPSGVVVRLVPAIEGTDAPVAVSCAVPDVDRQAEFLVAGLGARPEAGGYRLARTLVRLVADPGAGPAGPTWARGFRYVVAFVDDVVAAHDGLIALGAEHSVPPTRLADRCVFSWLRDPGGNWLELVQPATVAPLPDVAPIDQRWQQIVDWRETGRAIPAPAGG